MCGLNEKKKKKEKKEKEMKTTKGREYERMYDATEEHHGWDKLFVPIEVCFLPPTKSRA